MSHSLAQNTPLTCPECGHSFEARLWLIVDGEEHPEFLEQVRAGTLHHAICPRGHLLEVDAPLLLFRATAGRPLLFSPAQQTDSEQDRQQAERFLAALRGNLGDQWREEWLADGLFTVPREALPALLSDDPEAALADLLQQQFKQLPPALRDTLDEVLVALAVEGVNITSADDLSQALAERPALSAMLRQAAGDLLPPEQPG